MLQLWQKEIDRLGAVIGDDHTTSAHRGLANVVGLVCQTVEHRLNDAAEVGRETFAEGGGKEDEKRDVSLADVGARVARIGEDSGEETFETINAASLQHFGESLSSSLLVNSTRRRLENQHEVVNEIREVVLPESLHESSERLGGCGTSLGNGIDEDVAQEGDKL